MAMTESHRSHFSLCPFWQSATSSSSSSSTQTLTQNGLRQSTGSSAEGPNPRSSNKTVSSMARSLLPPRRRLRLDPASNLYFPYEPGKQVRSAVRLKNTSRSHVAFKYKNDSVLTAAASDLTLFWAANEMFQTTAPKSCYMRPPGGILAPGESIIATVFKFVENPENNEKQTDQKSKVKFKIMSLKIKGGIDYIPEMFDEQRDQVIIERVMRVVFLDVQRPSPQLEKLNRQLAEAEAELEARKKPPRETGPQVVGEGLVIDEWKERREKYLAQQLVEAVDSA